MNPTDPRTLAAIDAALSHVRTTAASALVRASELLGSAATAATRIYERDGLLSAQSDLRLKFSTFTRVFNEGLRERVMRELSPRHDPGRQLQTASWETLSLVEDAEVEERMFADRISQVIAHECEWELRELAAYMGALLRIGRADQDRNPLRPEVLGAVLYKAIEAVSPGHESRKLLARELGQVMAKGMHLCYPEIIRDLQARGVRPVHLSVRGVEGPGNELPFDRATSGYASMSHDEPQPLPGQGSGHGSSGGFNFDPAGSSGGRLASSRAAGFGSSGGGSGSGSLRGPAVGPEPQGGQRSSGAYGYAGGGAAQSSGDSAAIADAELMTLIRRLTFLSSRRGEFDAADAAPGGAAFGAEPASAFAQAGRGRSSGRGGASLLGPASALGGGTPGLRGEGLTGLMAVNLIRAHRDELRQASSGTLDHMVIDVVGSLFDQILSDSRVPPQMARQIARLQLPVLRVALNDASFFSSRRHPVRRFVNRIASLACAFDDFDDGPGLHFLARVRDLVQEIIEGDFDQVEVYAAKLSALEAFIAEQTENAVQSNASAATLFEGKESQLRVQQRYMQQLQAALAPLVMPEYLRDFLSQVWSQALALVVRRDGAEADRTQRLRRAARDLVLSVQPKSTPALRKKFLLQLPPLMKDLHEGLALIGWPEAAKKEFFGKLLPSHAESLKGQELSDLDRNMLSKQLESIFNLPLPSAEQLGPGDAVPQLDDAAVEQHFSPEEVQRVGLVEERAVDWDGAIDIDLSAEATEPSESTTPTELDPAAGALGLDVDLSAASADPAEPTRGPQLIDHVKVGFAYQMHLKDQWQKVRLSYVSQGRNFFVFTHGNKHKETLSLTSRMLARMCDSGRLRAFESTYLLERATARARKQLASMKAAAH